jgi:hypothetical protein
MDGSVLFRFLLREISIRQVRGDRHGLERFSDLRSRICYDKAAKIIFLLLILAVLIGRFFCLNEYHDSQWMVVIYTQIWLYT